MREIIMKAVVDTLNNVVNNDYVSAEYYHIFSSIGVPYIFDDVMFRIKDGRIVDSTGTVYHTYEEVVGKPHVCPVCGTYDMGIVPVTPIVKIKENGRDLMIDTGLAGNTYTEAMSDVACPTCRGPMLPFDRIESEICSTGIVYPYCQPPDKNVILSSVRSFYWDVLRNWYDGEEGETPEELAIDYVLAKYKGFIDLYGISPEEIEREIKEGEREWYAATVMHS